MEKITAPIYSMADFQVIDNIAVSADAALLRLSPADPSVRLSETDIRPGQFVQVKTPCNATFLRRPISICNVSEANNELWLLVRNAGAGSHAIMQTTAGGTLNLIAPLGSGFSIEKAGNRPLLTGGGVGVAPLLYLGKKLKAQGIDPVILLGARTKDLLLLTEAFANIGDLRISTDDGSCGEKGVVTSNTAFNESYTSIYCCGPMPMMKSVAKIAYAKEIFCEVSLENVMGCGIGACLCCVEKTVKGNVCVCKEGPVFNINQLLWQN